MTIIKKIKRNRLWIIAFLVMVPGLVGVYVNGLKQGYDEKLARATTDSQNMARVLEEQINSVIQKTDILLQHAAGEVVLRPGEKPHDADETHAYLKRLKASIPEVFRIRIIQPDGYSLASSLEEKPPVHSTGIVPISSATATTPRSGWIFRNPSRAAPTKAGKSCSAGA
jgi:hypothetical protein